MKMCFADSSHFGRSLIFCDFVIPCDSVSDCVFNENVRRAWPSEKSWSRSLISKSDMRGNPNADEIVLSITDKPRNVKRPTFLSLPYLPFKIARKLHLQISSNL